ncbi:MAG: DUF523 and DUF1722 domain-containing protein [Magnetococcales bacterium]|nr:DUF523 and DUF1722 domain-containing protein [Magnetococcales bacterium]MBF0151465.1 DUF523 and DUF1722 domain-containing protein [Magnetococcales bacterium]
MDDSITLGVSACLMGEPVRYDGRDKGDPRVMHRLSGVFRLIPFCPEAQAGLGIPRPPMRLVGDPRSPRLVTVATGQDLTEPLITHCTSECIRCTSMQLRGFIFKSRSPSCAVESAPIHDREGAVTAMGSGLWTRAFQQAFPMTVVVEEADLADEQGQRRFVERVLVADRWQKWVDGTVTAHHLTEFHARHKFQIMAHDREAMKSMGRLAAASGAAETLSYGRELFAAMARPDTLERHVDCMMHLFGFLKKRVSSEQKQEFLHLLEACRLGRRSRWEPWSWLRSRAQQHRIRYLLNQWYLFPDPRETQCHPVGPNNGTDSDGRHPMSFAW